MNWIVCSDVQGRSRLFRPAAGGERREDETGDQQMGRDFRTCGIAQLMLQCLGEHLHASLGRVVGRISGRRGDALLGAGIDDHGLFAMGE